MSLFLTEAFNNILFDLHLYSKNESLPEVVLAPVGPTLRRVGKLLAYMPGGGVVALIVPLLPPREFSLTCTVPVFERHVKDGSFKEKK